MKCSSYFFGLPHFQEICFAHYFAPEKRFKDLGRLRLLTCQLLRTLQPAENQWYSGSWGNAGTRAKSPQNILRQANRRSKTHTKTGLGSFEASNWCFFFFFGGRPLKNTSTKGTLLEGLAPGDFSKPCELLQSYPYPW